jgi:putative ABC transport system permease protein
MMIRSYIIIAIRNIYKRGAFSLINIAGLTIGLACSILIFMWVHHEFGYDRFHPDFRNIHRMLFRINMSGESIEAPAAMAPLAPVLTATFPEVDDLVRIHKEEKVNIGTDTENFLEPLLLYADSTFFTFFGFELETGNPDLVLKAPFSIVVTRELAEKIFGNTNPVGEILKINNHDYTVTGIASNPPTNSHISFGAIASFTTLYERSPGSMDEWLSLSYFTYLKFNRHFDSEEFLMKLNNLFAERFGERATEYGIRIEPGLQPIASIHLESKTMFEVTPPGDKASVNIFMAVAVFILLLACINFMNLSTSRASQRSKEVGVRKVIGASRADMIKQFLGESSAFTLVAMFLAIPLIEISLPAFNNITGVRLSFLSLENWKILAGLPVLILIVGVLAGSYPAFVLSGFNPLKTIKGETRVSSGNSPLRSGLIIFQFVISIALIICTIFVWQQLSYINSKDLGFNKHNKLIFQLVTRELRGKKNILEQEFSGLPGVTRVSFSSAHPGVLFAGTKYIPQGCEEMIGSYIDIDHHYIDMMGISISEGRGFDPAFFSDTTAIIINKAAVRSFGWTEPLEKTIVCGRSGDDKTFRVIGVVEDFHFKSMHQEVEPLFIHLLKDNPRYMTMEIQPGKLPMTLAGIKACWEKVNTYDPFEFSMLSDVYDVHYRAEKQLSRIFTFFSVLALIIAGMGIYGLASFMVDNRTKEIGIRKVFGASVLLIVTNFLKQFGWWLLIANIIAWAVAWYYMVNWLSIFAYKITVNNPVVFVLSALISAIIVIAAAGYQALKAANINPARSLKYE